MEDELYDLGVSESLAAMRSLPSGRDRTLIDELQAVIAAQARALDSVSAELEQIFVTVGRQRREHAEALDNARAFRGRLAILRGEVRERSYEAEIARLERDQARAEREQARAERDRARAEREQARAERDLAEERMLEACWMAEVAASYIK